MFKNEQKKPTHIFQMQPENKDYEYNIGIALSGGGAKGFAHLGILQALNDNGIYPEIISGTSAGAFAGVLYADGHKPKDIISFFKEKKFQEFAEFGIPQAGFFKSTRLRSFLKVHLKAKNFDDLEVALKVVATDIEDGVYKVFSQGDLVAAVVASCSVPIVFSPVEISGHYYVDGGLLKNFPVSPIRDKCRVVFGVNVSPIRKSGYKNSLKYVAERSFHYMSSSNTFQDRKLCDFLIESPNFSEYSMFDLEHVDQIYEAGYKLATEYLQNEEKKITTLLK